MQVGWQKAPQAPSDPPSAADRTHAPLLCSDRAAERFIDVMTPFVAGAAPQAEELARASADMAEQASASHPISSHPTPSHPIPSHPIPSHPDMAEQASAARRASAPASPRPPMLPPSPLLVIAVVVIARCRQDECTHTAPTALATRARRAGHVWGRLAQMTLAKTYFAEEAKATADECLSRWSTFFGQLATARDHAESDKWKQACKRR